MGGCDTHGVAWTSNYDDVTFCEKCLDPKVQKTLKWYKENNASLDNSNGELRKKLETIRKAIDIISMTLGENDSEDY